MNRSVMRAVALAAFGCGSIEEVGDYERERAEAECEILERCELGYWESEYTSPEDCVGEREDRLADLDDEIDDGGCDYVPEQAAFCVDQLRGMSCLDWGLSNAGNRACDLVWDCREER